MTVYSIIVTYSDRFNLVKEVIESCINEGIDKIIVVDNHSNDISRNKLKILENKLQNKLSVIYLQENTGSAGGYKRGLEEAYKSNDCEYIWLLDDDNKPEVGSLKVLKEFWERSNIEDRKHNLCLLSYRKDRELYKQAVILQDPNMVLGDINSFQGFHFRTIFKKCFRRINKNSIINRNTENSNGIVSAAPYGGMFFNKSIIDNIGYPEEKYFVYADDTDWSYRITQNGGKIYLLLNSLIVDLNPSWHTPGGNNTIFTSMSRGTSFRIYNTIKNRVIFERKDRVKNKFIYLLNILLFAIVLVPFTIINISNYFNFIKGIRHGFKAKY